ncbi:MAG: immunity 26/phosphotriesterase HocA family protein [Chloroflexaceae bacterium]|jgi:hypothetical protein|nr:immunity 26/phosphotriesterase HocA family protein [Chloroflexaceae bacterium]
MTNKKQQWKRGAVVRIALSNTLFGYGQMLDAPEYAFFDLCDAGASAPAGVAARPVIFRLWVMRYAHGSGRWQKIGIAPLQPMLEAPVLRFNQDPLKPEHIELGYDGTSGRLVTPEEAMLYERAAVWEPEHVEDRLRDYFDGKPNKWEESLRLRRPEQDI